MKIIASMLFALGLVAAAPFSPRAVITGVAEVVDGDGVSFGEVEIRLQGIAAPEDSRKYGQPGGAEATANLKGSSRARLSGVISMERLHPAATGPPEFVISMIKMSERCRFDRGLLEIVRSIPAVDMPQMRRPQGRRATICQKPISFRGIVEPFGLGSYLP